MLAKLGIGLPLPGKSLRERNEPASHEEGPQSSGAEHAMPLEVLGVCDWSIPMGVSGPGHPQL